MRKLAAAVSLLLAAGLAALALAGCGDGGNEPALTPAAWRAQANAICRRAATSIEAFRVPTNAGEIAPFTSGVLPLWDGVRKQMRALPPPPELAETAADLVTAYDYLSAALLEIHIATQRYDGARRVEAIRKSRVAARDITVRSQAMGLTACADQRIP